MPVPATSGQLRTRVQDMQIGDYMKFYQDANLGFIPADDTITTELPVTGNASPNHTGKFFYMVKVAKGLLISDRVTLHTYSWDSLNSGKWIQGKAQDFGTLVPVMTSHTAPSGAASANAEFTNGSTGVSYPAWKAFNGTLTNGDDCWAVQGTSGWIQYQFASPTVVKGYSLTPQTSNVNGGPKDWVFEGSNDGVTWVALDVRTNQIGWAASVYKQYTFDNETAYAYYRITISNNNGHSYTTIGELKLLEMAGEIRSIKGGVTYADTNGDRSITDFGRGGWPTNNEWDSYIEKFSYIQSGKTLDDVFHCHSAIYTWTQDVPAGNLTRYNNAYTAINTHRVWRGKSPSIPTLQGYAFAPSNGTLADIGFRPVFEYQE